MCSKLVEETDRRLIKAKDRSRRSKTADAMLRLKRSSRTFLRTFITRN
ncbi:TraY domain-containing protein [Klebsiella pneumoniae]